MNNELLKVLKSNMYKYATEVNRLVEKYNRMKESGASISELNSVAAKAQDANAKYSCVKSEYEEYVYRYERYTYLEKTGGKKCNDARVDFYACQIHLLFKYDIEKKIINNEPTSCITEKKLEKVQLEEYTHSKPKKGSKLLAGALIFASALGFGYGLSACTHNINEPAIVDVDTDTEDKTGEEVKNEEPKVDDKVTMPEEKIDNIKPEEPKQEEPKQEEPKQEEPKVEEPNKEEVIVPEEPKQEEINNNETITTNDFAYLKETSTLYDSENEDKQELSSVEKYQKVLRLSTDGNYDYVQTEDLQYGYIESSKLEVLPDMYVEVDISDQTVELYKDKNIILTTLCVTGKDSTPTRIGYFPIKYKTYDTYLKGPGYNSHVYYWMPFDGGIGLHDAAWRSEFGGDIHFNGGSHGCINMPHDAAKTIYENVSAGTKVLVHN